MTTADRLGDLLFGRRLRLRVAMWVSRCPDRPFYLGEVAAGVRYTPSGVRDELARLKQLGMIKRAPRQAGTRRVYYERLDSPLWAIIDSASRCVRVQPSGRKGVSVGEPRRLHVVQRGGRSTAEVS